MQKAMDKVKEEGMEKVMEVVAEEEDAEEEGAEEEEEEGAEEEGAEEEAEEEVFGIFLT